MEIEPEHLTFREKLRNMERLSTNESFSKDWLFKKPVVRRHSMLPTFSDIESGPVPVLTPPVPLAPPTVKTVSVSMTPSDVEKVSALPCPSEEGKVLPGPSKVKRVLPCPSIKGSVVPSSLEVERVLPCPSIEGRLLPCPSEVLPTPTGVERVSRPPAPPVGLKRISGPVPLTGTNYVNVQLNQSPPANVSESVSVMAPAIDGGDTVELRVKEPKRLTAMPQSVTDDFEHKNYALESFQTTDKKETCVAMKPGPDIDLLMIGKTGNGKSALGNSLLQQKAFKSKPSTTSVTKEVTYEVTERNGRKIKFGGRFTKEDSGTIDYLKRMFGADFVKRFCILVMTCGDQFEQEVKKLSFNEWINKEGGVLPKLVNECEQRVMLFDNKTTDNSKSQKQLNDLIQMIESLIHNNSRYTNEQFELAKSERHSFILNSRKPIITDETMAECNIIIQHFKHVQATIQNDNDTTLLEELLARANILYEGLVSKDNGTGVLNELIAHVRSIQNSISDEIKLCHRIAEFKEHLRRENEKRLNEELKRSSDILDNVIAEQRQLYETDIQSCKEEFKNIFEKTYELEKWNKSLKSKGRVHFTLIKEKVVRRSKHRNKVKPNSEAWD